MSLSKEVWQTLSAIDVSKHIEKKGNLSYLSWAWAYGTMMEHYPELHYSFEEDKCDTTGTVEISCVVHIHTGGEQDQVMMRHMWLPVMDHRNKAIINPDKFAINSSKMRCLVKCFAMFGLGHYIYAGEDINPVIANAVISDHQAAELIMLMDECDADTIAFCNHFKCENPYKLLASQYDRAMHALKAKKKPMTDDQLAAVGKKIAGKS
tara:strand:+ start:31 stop:654 length:624 start_codon:yes stop_codon:yes gene_type:complete